MIDPRDASRDKIWCIALVATLRVDDIQRVTAEFLRLRDEVAVEQLAEADRTKRLAGLLRDAESKASYLATKGPAA
ncbi:MAG: hypothetical protein WC935_00040 [Thermoleophilia bacterium]